MPFSPRAVPTQVRTRRLRRSLATAPKARVTSVGAGGLARFAADRSISSSVSAQ